MANQGNDRVEEDKKMPQTVDNIQGQEVQQEIYQQASDLGYAIESDANQKETQQGIESLQNFVDSEKITMEHIKGTPLEQTMLSVFSDASFNSYAELKDKTPEQRMEIVFRKVNRVLKKFYARKFNLSENEQPPEYLSKIIIPATERYLMEILRESGQETNINFLGAIQNISFDSLNTMVSDITEFSNRFLGPFKGGKALLNAMDFLALPKNQVLLKNLNNPYDFYEKFLNSPIRSQQNTSDKGIDVSKITWEQIGFDINNQKTGDELQQALQEGKQKMSTRLGSIQMVNSPETVKKILGVLDRADEFFGKTQKIGDSLLDQMDGVGSIAQVLKSTLGIDMRGELKTMPVVGSIINFVLGLLGFSGGIDGVERSWKRRRLDRELGTEQKDYIEEMYDTYMKDKKINENTAEDLIRTYRLNIGANEKQKFAVDVSLLKEKISEKISLNPNILNLSTLASVNTIDFKGKNFVETISQNGKKEYKLKQNLTEEERNNFIEGYIQSILIYYSDTSNIDKLKDADTLAFIMVSGISLNKDNVIDGVEAEAFLPEEFYSNPNNGNQDNGSEDKDQPSDGSETPAVKNHNPGNIKGSDGKFKEYANDQEGWDDLISYIDRVKKGEHSAYNSECTLEEFFHTYDPGNPTVYADHVAKWLGVGKTTKIKDIETKKLATAIARQEDSKMYDKLLAQGITSQDLLVA